ncbi:hypothetical protein niasHT_003830 [Heterodera trifolii]|uniref:Uncharacterized protein n=1 Tax=Heterodera trifolii TaxID=157864 RepID=A0ABD2LUW8_9BILA
MSTSGAQISIRCDAQELLMGMLPEGTENNLAYSSDENGMPNSVRTAQRPVVVMVAPEKQKNGEETKVGREKDEQKQQKQKQICGEIRQKLKLEEQ